MRCAPRVLRMAVVSQSSVKFGKKRVFLVGTINFRKMMFCKKVGSRGRLSAVKWNQSLQRESRLFDEVAVMAGRVSAVREVKGLPVEYSLLLL